MNWKDGHSHGDLTISVDLCQSDSAVAPIAVSDPLKDKRQKTKGCLAMTKKHFVALADAVRRYNENAFKHGTNIVSPLQFTDTQIFALADFCQSQNAQFDRERWLAYVNGECGKNGGRK